MTGEMRVSDQKSLLERLLAEAGMSYTVVTRCPSELCLVCDGDGATRAA